MFSKAKRDKTTDRRLPEEFNGDAMMSDQNNGRHNDARNGQRQKSVRTTPFGVPSLISGDMVIKGEIRSEGEVQFDGELEGNIHAKGIVIGEGATVRGEVVAEKVKVAGTVKGQIRATRVELTATARVDGDILHTALMIEAGARFDGTCRHAENPFGDAPRKTATQDDTPVAVAPAEVPNVPREREAKLREATGALRAEEAPVGEPAPVEPLTAVRPAVGKPMTAKANLR